jgi:hypothetical protein
VGSESDRRVQIQNSGTTAESGSRSYALYSARIDVLYTYSNRLTSRKARPHVLKKTLATLKYNSYSDMECRNKKTAKFGRRRIDIMQGGTNSRATAQQGVCVSVSLTHVSSIIKLLAKVQTVVDFAGVYICNLGQLCPTCSHAPGYSECKDHAHRPTYCVS